MNDEQPRLIGFDDVINALVEVFAERERKFIEEDNKVLHPEQARLTYGDHFVVLGGLDLDQPELRFLIFGHVPPLADFQQIKDLAFEAEVERLIRQHTLPAYTWSKYHPTRSRPSKVRASLAWPIHTEVFEAARVAGFDEAEFTPFLEAHLAITRAAYQAHRQTVGLA